MRVRSNRRKGVGSIELPLDPTLLGTQKFLNRRQLDPGRNDDLDRAVTQRPEANLARPSAPNYGVRHPPWSQRHLAARHFLASFYTR